MGPPLESTNSSQTLVQHAPNDDISSGSVSGASTFADVDLSADESDADEENDGFEHYKEWHGDHWDEVEYVGRWKNWDIGHGWPHSFVRSDELSKPNDQLLEAPKNRHWMQKLTGLQQKDLPFLKVYVAGIPKLPLFEDATTGDHYSLHIHPGTLVCLDRIYCRDNLAPTPTTPTPWRRLADPLYKVRYRRPVADDEIHDKGLALPNHIIVLGNLAVRTSLRKAWDPQITPTEDTDYLVAIDAEHEDLPVWLIVSRSTLRDRAEHNGKNHPQLPVFKGLLKDDSYGYDTACIFRSIRDISGPTDFEEVCDLVRKTRAAADPGLLNIEEKKMAELSGQTLPVDWHNTTPLEKDPSPPPKQIIEDDFDVGEYDFRRAYTF